MSILPSCIDFYWACCEWARLHFRSTALKNKYFRLFFI